MECCKKFCNIVTKSRRKNQCTKIKNAFARIAVLNLFLPQENKNFTQKKGLQMSLKDALIAGMLANKEARKDFMTLYAQAVALKHKFLSNQSKAKTYTAENVLLK